MLSLHQWYYLSELQSQNKNVICYTQVIDFIDLVSQDAYVNMGHLTLLGCLMVNALLESLSEVDFLSANSVTLVHRLRYSGQLGGQCFFKFNFVDNVAATVSYD